MQEQIKKLLGNITMMENNLQSSQIKLNNGEITQEYFNTLKRDVNNRTKEIKKEISQIKKGGK